MEQPFDLEKWDSLKQRFGPIYDFFVQAERDGTLLTSREIQKHVFPKEISTVRKYISRYWRWFLKPTGSQRRSILYRCEGIDGYPQEYFLIAHQTNQMQYFLHFAESIRVYDAAKANRRAEREAQALASHLPIPELDLEPVEALEDQQQAPSDLGIGQPMLEELVDSEEEEMIEEDEVPSVAEATPVLQNLVLPDIRDSVFAEPIDEHIEETEEEISEIDEELPNIKEIPIANKQSNPKSRFIAQTIVLLLLLIALAVAGYFVIRRWLSM